MLSQKKIMPYLFRLGLNNLIPNFIGALIIVVYLNYFNLNTYHFIPSNLSFSIWATVFVFLMAMILSATRDRRMRILLTKLVSNSIEVEEKNELKLKVLNSPYFGLYMTAMGWLAAGLFIPLAHFIQGASLGYCVSLFLEIFLIGGSLAAIISFYMSDLFIRKMSLEFFPDGDFTQVGPVKNIRFYVRLMIAFWIGGMLPVFLSSYYSKQYIIQLITNGPNEIIAFKYRILIFFAFFLSIFMSIVSSRYFRRQMGKPLIQLEKSMNQVKNGDFNVSLPVVQKDEIGNVFAGFNQMAKGLREREQIKEAFGKFVSPNIRDEILKGNMELGGEKKEATVLFCDIRKFTTLSEKLNAAEVVDLLNSYFNEMVQPIFKNGGVLDKFIGDALMAVFGVPGQDSKHAENALKTALTMLKKLESFNEIRKMSGQEPIEIGIGINSGELIAGNIGSSERMEYTVIGDTVNIASRLETLTKEYGQPIIISEYTYSCLSKNPEFQFKELGEVTVKGRVKAFKIYSPVISVKNKI